jgi:hypothetical protein
MCSSARDLSAKISKLIAPALYYQAFGGAIIMELGDKVQTSWSP